MVTDRQLQEQVYCQPAIVSTFPTASQRVSKANRTAANRVEWNLLVPPVPGLFTWCQTGHLQPVGGGGQSSLNAGHSHFHFSYFPSIFFAAELKLKVHSRDSEKNDIFLSRSISRSKSFNPILRFPPWMRFDHSERITTGFIDPFVEFSRYHSSSLRHHTGTLLK